MFFRQLVTPGLSVYSYLLGDESTKRCAVIDPTRHVVPYIVQTQQAGYEITAILETHVHADFVSGAKELKHQLNEKPLIYASGTGGGEWIPKYTDKVVTNGDELKLGDLRLKALHTPGHTPEHLIWLCFDDARSRDSPWFAFTGDALFVGSVGRPDLLGKEAMASLATQLYHTLFDVFGRLPDFMEIFPSHGEGSLCGKALKMRGCSTLGYERRCNPYLKREPEAHWMSQFEKNQLPVPPYFHRVKKMNIEGPSLLNTLKTLKWGEEKMIPELDQLFLLDIRLPESFAQTHLKGALNIPASPTFAQWAGYMLPENIPIGIVVESHHVISEIIDLLRMMGFDQNLWIIPFEDAQYPKPYPLTSFPMTDVTELSKRDTYIVDVRTPEEWRGGHIANAHHIELINLEREIHTLPKDRLIAVTCRSGHRASLAASLLEKSGFSVTNLRGGMQAWKQAGLPVVLG